jgi:hypothetical protein
MRGDSLWCSGWEMWKYGFTFYAMGHSERFFSGTGEDLRVKSPRFWEITPTFNPELLLVWSMFFDDLGDNMETKKVRKFFFFCNKFLETWPWQKSGGYPMTLSESVPHHLIRHLNQDKCHHYGNNQKKAYLWTIPIYIYSKQCKWQLAIVLHYIHYVYIMKYYSSVNLHETYIVINIYSS